MQTATLLAGHCWCFILCPIAAIGMPITGTPLTLQARQQAGGEAQRQQQRQQHGAAAVEGVEAARAAAPGLDLRMSAGAQHSASWVFQW